MPIYTGADVREDRTIDTDVCIVGSGAGGAHVAARLAEAGKRVVVLEDGGLHISADFNMREATMVPRLYQDGGARGTDDGSISILQGRAVGGTTVVNWTTCFRTPERVIEHWHEHHGVAGLDHAALEPHWERIEKRLNVTAMELAQVNANNRVIWNGAEALGWSKHLLNRNVKHCGHTGYCGMGCPIDAKQSMLVTMIPDAVRADADVYANMWVERVVTSGKRVTEVVARVRDPKTDRLTGHTLTVRGKLVVLAGGAINTPAVLLRSELNANGRVGKRTFLHPCACVASAHKTKIEGFHGSPQYVACDEFSFERHSHEKMTYLIEAVPIFPLSIGSAGSAFGTELQNLADQFAYVSASCALLHDGFDIHDPDEGGSVTLREDGSPTLKYKWTERLMHGLREATKSSALLQLKGGADYVMTFHAPGIKISKPDELKQLDGAAYGPGQMGVFSAHVMGGCAMGKDHKTSVVDSATLRHHEFDNLFVVDGSVYPTSTTVNPQLSIYGLASWASTHLVQAV